MAASSSSGEKHDVFISFSGEDTRESFTSFLYDALRSNQIQAYMDEHQLERGDEISETLMKAIEESTISVIIFSEKYASSRWCLNELVKIVECQKRNGQIVMPVFYRIDPSIVRKQKEGYAVAFAIHEKRFKDEKVNQWRKALEDAADISGLHSKQFRTEPLLVQKIVADIWLLLRKKRTSNGIMYKGLYGIPERIKKIEPLLGIGSPDVRIIGICGMGGIGKTTLASAVFQKLYPLFEGRCFLDNVREASEGHRVDQLRNKLLTELFNDRAILSLDTPFVVSPCIGDRFRRKKVLIVLDDVDCSIDLEALIKGYEEHAPGSRIIVTSRDAHVLKNVTNQIYDVDGLDNSESLHLFHLHAFHNERPPKDYEKLSKRAVKYASGNPLALKVLGSFLHSRPIEDWNSALKKLEMVPDKKIQKVLSISYEGLDHMERELFLDIACFFAHLDNSKFKRDTVESILDDEGSSFTKIGISVLNDKSLITLHGPNRIIRTHNLLRQMGFTKVCEEDNEPGSRSRLWISKDICHVLETASGTARIKSVSLHLCDLTEDVKVNPAAFSKMSSLQYFKIICHEKAKFRLHISDDGRGPEFYPSNKLRHFSWDSYPYKSFPSGLIPENLVQLNLTDSQLVQFWNEDQPAPALEKLQSIELHGSKNLTQIPNLSRAINIKSICLARCSSLVQVPSYFKDLKKLWYLNLTDCSNLIEVEGAGKNLTKLQLGGTAIEAVPSSIACLSGLSELELRGTMIKELPQSSIENLNALSRLDVSYCQNLESIPELPPSLTSLNVSCCENLKSIQELPPSLRNLFAGDCKSLETISIWRRTPLIEEYRRCLCACRGYRFDNCQKLDQNLTNNIIPHAAWLEILCAARSQRKLESKFHDRGLPIIVFCYPGDDIPSYFISHIDPGTSINIELPSNWCDANFLGFAFCFVLDMSEFSCENLLDRIRIRFECVFSFLNDDGEDEYQVPITGYLYYCSKLNSDHVLILYDYDLSYSKLQEKFEANWSSISIAAKASFDFRLSLYPVDDSQNSGFQQSDGGSQYLCCNRCCKIIKKCGFWLIYDEEEGGTLMDNDQKPKEEETERFAQLSQVSGGTTHEVVCLGDEKLNANTATAATAAEEEETRRLAQLSLVSGASTSHEVVCFGDEKVNTNTEEKESYTNTSAQEEPSFTEWLLYLS